MSQALAVHQALSRWGHEVTGVVAGRHGARSLPDYVTRAFAVSIVQLPSPGFVFIGSRAVNLAGTAWRALAEHAAWRASIRRLREAVEESRPDLVINFYEPLTGLAQLVDPLDVPVLSIAHQHMIGHPAHRTPFTALPDEIALQLFSDLVGFRSWKLALSLYPAPDRLRRHTTVGPPILRMELFALLPQEGGDYLVYLVNHGYHKEIRAWHDRHPLVGIRCFYDLPGAPEVEEVDPWLSFHRLDGEAFLRRMASCRAVVSTAGFESISEAAWLGKPVFVVPVERHPEQQWNARDVVQAGFGIADTTFRLDRLAELPARRDSAEFREWVSRMEEILQIVIERAVSCAVVRSSAP